MDLDKGGTEGVCWRRMFKEDGERGWIWRMVVLKENGVQYGMQQALEGRREMDVLSPMVVFYCGGYNGI